MSNAPLQLQNICKNYGALRVTDHVSLNIEAGELHAIIGPNGAGKTTLIHQISGHAQSDSGRIIFDGQDVSRLPMAERARMGLVRSFQITSILPRFSALENQLLRQCIEGTSAERHRHGTTVALRPRRSRKRAGRTDVAWRETPA